MTTSTTRRMAMAGALLIACAMHIPASAQAVNYPNRPVKVIVPFVPGGNADSTARIFAEAYSRRLGQPFVIDNRGGAGGMIGASQMARSEPDGYTLMMATTGPIVASWQLAGKAATYSLNDMKAVALLSYVPGVIVVNANSAIKNYQDLAAYGKRNSEGLKFGHPGNGTAGHVNILQMQKALSQKYIVVGYKGAGPAVQDLLGGQLDAVATDLPSALQLIKGGKLRAIGVVFPTRVPSLPEVPTMIEVRQPEIDIAPFTAVMAPKALPQPLVDKLVEANNAALADTTVRKRIEDIGGVPTKMSNPEFEKFLGRQTATYASLIQSGILLAE